MADLACGHSRHFRHNPPWQEREWVTTQQGRDRFLGSEVDCKKCDGETAMKKLNVLFLCTGNSCRSQMAEGWARHLRGDRIEAFSAGLEARGLNPSAVKVMQEAGVDISRQKSQRVEEVLNVPFDYVVTVCSHADEHCPVFPGKARVVHRGFDDPPRLAKDAASEEEALAHYRRVRDEIRGFVESLPEFLQTRK